MAIVFRFPSLVRLGLCCALLGAAARAAAEEPVFEFLRALQDHGYGEAAIDYLEQLRSGQRVPKELAETLDLELSRSYRVAVGEAFNPAEAEARTAKAQAHLDKFLKEHADHPEVARAMESWGDLALDRGLQHLRQAAASKDPAQKEKLRAAARADFAEARPRFVDATARYLEQFSQLKSALSKPANKRARPSAQSSRKQRQADEAVRDAEVAWLECRFKSAKLDFYSAQTYPDPKAPECIAALAAAAKAFDAVFQSYRESLVGLHAHLWHGRTADEQGNDQLALDIYDEVLATAPEGREHASGLEPLFAQAQYYRLLVLKRMQGPEAFLAEANAWLEVHQSWRKLDGYQGVLLEVARANLKQAAGSTGGKKTALTQSALTMLANIAKVRSEHQQEAILLRRAHTKTKSADPATVKTFDEGLALAEAAIESQDWPGAVEMFSRALALATPATTEKLKTQALTRQDQARYQLAVSQFGAGNYQECLATAEQIAADRPESAQAPAASSLAVSSALSLYARAEDKQAAFARLDTIAQRMIQRWPDKAEADDARIALGQASLVRGDLAAASQAFEQVNPRSARYGVAMFLAGQTNWRLYLSAKARSSEAADSAAASQSLDELRAKAAGQLQTSLDAQRKTAETGKPPSSPQLVDVQLLLAELKLEAGEPRAAAELLEPLAESIRNQKPKPLDNSHLRVLLAAARAAAALDQLPKTAAIAGLLVELGEDTAAVNGVANSMLKLLVDGWKQAEADAIDARTAGDPARRSAAESAAAERKKLVGQLVTPLATRQQNSLAALVYIADTAAALDQTDTARELYQAILAQADSNTAFKQANAQALTRIKAQLVGLLRQKGQFAQGLEAVNQLIDEYPNALEPKMEKGRLLQDWADTEPARLDDAVAHWTALRTRLARLVKKPPEYYEVVYSAAQCLFTEGVKNRNPQKALQSEQLLNATLVLSPKLSGPEMVARYKELLAKSRQLQGRK